MKPRIVLGLLLALSIVGQAIAAVDTSGTAFSADSADKWTLHALASGSTRLSDYGDNLAAAAKDAGAAGGVIVDRDVTVSADSTISSGLWVSPNSSISVAAGKTLTINGPITAGPWQIFSGAGNIAGKPKLENGVRPEWFGAVGDGVADDGPALQKAMDLASACGSFVNGGDRLYGSTQALTLRSGIRFNRASYGDGGGPTGIKCLKGGITLIRFEKQHVSVDNLTLHGGGQSSNGFHFNYNATGGGVAFAVNMRNFRAYNFAGFGLKIEKVWDSLFDNISIEKCGTASAYAFSVEDGGGTSNESQFNRIQVEMSNHKAMYVSPSTLNCLFNDIHSERSSNDGTETTHLLQGNSCSFINVRLEDADANGPVALFGGAFTKYVNVRGANLKITVDSTGRWPVSLDTIYASALTLLGLPRHEVKNVVVKTMTISYAEKASISSCSATSLMINGNSVGVAGVSFRDCAFTGTSFTGLQATTKLRFQDSALSVASSTSNSPGATVRLSGCSVADIVSTDNNLRFDISNGSVVTAMSARPKYLYGHDSTLPFVSKTDGFEKHDNCTLTGDMTTAHNQYVELLNCIVSGTVTLNNDLAAIRAMGTRFDGALGYSTGAAYGVLDESCLCLGIVHARWHTAFETTAKVNAYIKRQGIRVINPKPTSNDLIGYVLIDATGAGVWKGLGAVSP